MPTRNPWTKTGTREVYRNPWMTLVEDRVIHPDGSEGIYAYYRTRIATGVVAMTPAREVYLVGQFRYPTEMYSWEIVEGGTEPGEEPLAAIQRELREEAGLVARRWTPLGGEFHLSNCISSEIGFVYLAEDLEDVEPEPEATEVLQVRRVPLEEALAMVDRNEIVDAVSQVALLRLDRMLRTNRRSRG
jgi:8-oxo-dGTP pyrophosphatase MutT (NUDIX family)